MSLSNKSRNKVIVVTGGIGSGKSKVCEIFTKQGATVISADALARIASEDSKEEIKENFKEVFLQDGSLDRKKLAQIVFSDKKEKLKLEQILHPKIQKLADLEFDKAVKAGNNIIVYECPLFVEAGLKKQDYKAVIVIDVKPEIAIERTTKRDQSTTSEVTKRISMQANREERIKVADYLIDNNGDLSQLEQNVLNVIKNLRTNLPNSI